MNTIFVSPFEIFLADAKAQNPNVSKNDVMRVFLEKKGYVFGGGICPVLFSKALNNDFDLHIVECKANKDGFWFGAYLVRLVNRGEINIIFDFSLSFDLLSHFCIKIEEVETKMAKFAEILIS